MEKERIQELIRKFNAQEATPDDFRAIEALLEAGAIDLSALQDVHSLEEKIQKIEIPSPSVALNEKFYDMLSHEMKAGRSFSWRKFFSWSGLMPAMALASLTLVIGVGLGYMLRPASSNSEIAKVNGELKQLREMMMLSLLEKGSATERLKAVNLTEEMDAASAKVTGALLQTLNEDSNVNVRLAALEALKPYIRDHHVREALIRSIGKQDSPLVQVGLAELMAAFHIKSSVKELEKIVQSDKTPDDVKSRIKQSIDVII